MKSNDLDTDGISVLGSWAGNDGAIYGVGGSGSIRVKDTDSRVTPEFTTGVTNHGGTRSTARSMWMARRFSRGRRPHLHRADDVIEVAVVFNRKIDVEGDLHLNIEWVPTTPMGGCRPRPTAARAPIP